MNADSITQLNIIPSLDFGLLLPLQLGLCSSGTLLGVGWQLVIVVSEHPISFSMTLEDGTDTLS
jgi:hypothetical protein